MASTLKEVRAHMQELSNPQIAGHSLRFFKTGPGEYGEGDTFLGIRVPVTRKAAKKFEDLPRDQVLKLLKSRFHEERLLALFMLVARFKKGDEEQRKQIFQAYLDHTDYVNNWDLVDSSAHQIVGGYLLERDRKPLFRLVKSKSLWERRISIIATFHFIQRDDFADSLKLAEILLPDEQDLIHKAVGWMLREVGKHDLSAEEEFLRKHYKNMPRTMLRYAIEKFDERKRQGYLKGLL